MYQTTDGVKKLYKKHYRQTVVITFSGTDETTVFTEADLIQNSLSVDRYTVTGNTLEVGSAVSAELTFKLDNRNGKFDNLALEGAEIFAKIGIKKWDADKWENAQMDYIPLGYFTVSGSPRHLRTIEITADDRMVKFDQLVNESYFYDNATVESYIRSCCQACGVTLATDISKLTNASYKIPAFPSGDDITYRTVIQWCAAITGTCAYIDWNGYLRFEWYTDNITGETISPSERYDSDIYENDVVITGVSATISNDDGDDEEYSSGTDDYALDLSECSLLQSAGDVQSAIEALGAKLIGFTYRPYSCETKPMPWLYPLDTISFVDKNGVTHSTIITNATFHINAHSEFEGKGETATSNSYYQQSLTAKIAQILNNTKKNTIRLTSAEAMIVAFNEALSNASGLYSTTTTADDGSITYYFHDKSDLESSNVIYMFNAGGFAWTTSGWNDGSPTWQYGFDSNGDGILNNVLINYLQTRKLTADEVDVATIVGAINDDSGDSELYITADKIKIGSSSLTDTLEMYVTSSSLTAKLTEYATKTGGTSSSFSYSLTASSFILQANDETVFSCTSDGVEVIGKITATSGEIGGFVIGTNSLTNSGGSYIRIASGSYYTQMSSGSMGSYYEDSNGYTRGTVFTTTAIHLSNYISSTYTGLRIIASYTKRTNISSYDGKSTTVAEAAIIPYMTPTYNVDGDYTTSVGATSFIIGARRGVAKSPYTTVYEWGAYFRIASYNRIELCFDSSLGGAVVIKDTYTGKEYDLTSLVG